MVKQQNKEKTLNYKQLYEETLLDIDKKQKEIDNLKNTVKSYRFQIYGINAYEIFGYELGYENKSPKKLDEWIENKVKNLGDFLNYRLSFYFSKKDLDNMDIKRKLSSKNGISIVILLFILLVIPLFILLCIFLDYCIKN